MSAPRKLRPSISLKRKKGKTPPKIKIYGFCEGKNTEPHFIKKFSAMHGNGLVDIEIVGAAGDPFTIVSRACDKKKELDKIAKKGDDSLNYFFEVWAIFDRDEHRRINDAYIKAKANKVYIAFSDPCFEIWPLWYFKNQTAAIHRHALQKDLTNYLPDYDDKGSKFICPTQLPDNYLLAKNRAKMRNAELLATDSIDKNPYSDVYKLFDKIISNGK